MSHTSGPCRTLPGAIFTPLLGSKCDEHPDRTAMKRVQGETDSFGAEYIYMCAACYEAYRTRDTTPEQTGCCDWCSKSATDLRPHRDFEEGQAGPVYRVCGDCRRKERDYLADELEY